MTYGTSINCLDIEGEYNHLAFKKLFVSTYLLLSAYECKMFFLSYCYIHFLYLCIRIHKMLTPDPLFSLLVCTPVHPRCLEVLPYSLGVSTISESVVDNFLDLHFGFPSSCDERYRKLLCSDLYKPCPGSGFGVGFCSDVCEDIQRSCQLLFAFFPTLSFPVDCDTLPNSIFDEDLYDEYGLCN